MLSLPQPISRLTALAAKLNPWKSRLEPAQPRPLVIGQQTHGIRRGQIHPHILFIVERLHHNGHQTLIVGGAVRDLLLGRAPKDFDLVTSARPEQVRRLFRNARIIGRRFRLVLLRFGEMKVEVSTFRGPVRHTREGMIHRDNSYGTPSEDAFRRDFTVNALMFDPLDMTLIDYVGGLEDLQARRIRTISPPQVSFTEDPVRILRAIRFKIRLGFALDPVVQSAIRPMSDGLHRVTRHRLADELQRFLACGMAQEIFAEFNRHGLLAPLLGMEGHEWFFGQSTGLAALEALHPYLAALDAWAAAGRDPLPPTVVLLGALTTLARQPFRHYLEGRLGDSPEDRRVLRTIKQRLPKMLGEWGLLRGQVEPALRILGAARLAIGAYAQLERPLRKPRLGEREAILLVALIAPQVGVPQHLADAQLARVPHLPDLPILDHPRPANRPMDDRGPDDEEARQEPGRRRRPRRRSRGRRRSGDTAAAG
jgi:tRNA nucleotidyltransferase/poly(A) polymerase